MDIWLPLLNTLEANHPLFSRTLVSEIVNTLVPREREIIGDSNQKQDLTYELCLAAWAAFIIQRERPELQGDSLVARSTSRREAALSELIIAMGPGSGEGEALSYGKG